MAKFNLEMEIAGLVGVKKVLDRLPDKVARRVIGPAMTAASKPVWKEARKNLRASGINDASQLAKSLGTVRRPRRRKGQRLAVIGPRSSDRYSFVSTADGKNVIPANIMHLLEYGHRIVTPAGVRGRTRAFGFLRAAFDSTKAEVVAAFRRAALKGVEKQAGRK